MSAAGLLALYVSALHGVSTQAASGLLMCGALLSAQAGFQLYAIWHDPSRYYENRCASS